MSNFSDALETEIRLSTKPKRVIAETAGLSASYLSHVLSDFREVTPHILAQLLRAFEAEPRKRLIQAFIRDALEKVKKSAQADEASKVIVSDLDALLDVDLGELFNAEDRIGKLTPPQAAVLSRVIKRTETDAVFGAVLLEVLTGLLKIPAASQQAPQKQRAYTPVDD